MNNVAASVSNSVITLFLIMLVGYAARMFGVIDKASTQKLSKFLICVTNPLLIVRSFQQDFTAGKLSAIFTVLGCSLVLHLAATVVALFMFRKKRPFSSSVLRFCMIFSNCGFMGYPLLQAAFPQNGLFYGACYVLFFTVYMWTFGVFLLSTGSRDGKGTSLRKAFLNPGVIGAVVGILLFVCRIRLGGVIFSAVDMTAGMTFPLSMIILGSMLTELPLKKLLFSADVYVVTFIKLLAFPLTVLAVCLLFGIPQTNTVVCVIMACTPVAAKAPLLAETYKADRNTALSCVGLSTLFSVVTIPLVMFITELAYRS